ncbi:phosphotransferase [Virgibacillus salidurans]|uniref:phosphotransferase n=1 Tax=Virgibacillus salidurans TaxID=2831673 RepID=UPI001F43D853|nr:phosphotransferase [Virgibacillus sp. NKC19-16]
MQKFGFYTEEEPISIYPFSPVYHVMLEKGDVIVKKTQRPIERAYRLIEYTTFLSDNGIKVVTPVNLNRHNPQTIDGETYVVYPYIEGSTYTGKDNEIYEAGKFFGRIHSHSPKENVYQLEEYDVYDFTVEEVEESMQNIERNAAKYEFVLDSVQHKEKLIQIVSQQEELQNSNLPNVVTPYDFKANNLIYTPEPYLIDPDNAGWIPRIFDLALALLLFHNELSTAPDTIFTPEQWKLFLSGYNKSVHLTDLEHSYWQKTIEHVFLDEVMWLLEEANEDWSDPSQRMLFESLLRVLMDASDYGIE